MFDTVNGLPVHALVVHAVVVLLPLMSLATVVVAVQPRWRQAGIPWVVAGNAAVVVLAFVATQSGERLQSRLSGLTGSPAATEHAELGDVLPYYALALFVASALVLLAVRRGQAPLLSGTVVLAVVAAVAAAWWTYRVGDSGAASVWGELIENTEEP